MENGFIQLRRGILEHLQSGKMYVPDLSIYSILHLTANPSSGILFTKVSAISSMFNLPNSMVRKSLERLESGLYIKRFVLRASTKPYPVLIHKFFITVGAMTGRYLNAIETIDWKHPVYYFGEEGARKGRGRGEEGARNQLQSHDSNRNSQTVELRSRELRSKNNPRVQTPHALPTAPARIIQNQDAKAKRITVEIERLMASVVGCGPSDRADVEWVQHRIDELYADLERNRVPVDPGTYALHFATCRGRLANHEGKKKVIQFPAGGHAQKKIDFDGAV